MCVCLLEPIQVLDILPQPCAENSSTVSQSSCSEFSRSVAQFINTACRVILKGKVRAAHRKLYSSLTVSIYSSVNNFPFSNEATTSSLLIFHASLMRLSFFSERCVTGLWFSHYSQCTGSVLWQNRSLSLFPLLTEDHRAKFKTNNKITGA